MKSREIEGLLPAVFRRVVRTGTPLRALLEVMEALHAPDEEILTDLPSYFDPYTTPDEFVPYLATWVDLDWLLPSCGLGRLRELIAAAPELSRWRGTAEGLERFLETATGVQGFGVDDAVKAKPFHIVVRAPASAKSCQALVEKIVEMEKPAYVTHHIKWLDNPGAGG